MRRTFLPLILLSATFAIAADTILTWPAGDSGKDTVLRFTVGKLRQVSSVSGQTDYLGEALAENLSNKAIPSASFYIYLVDKTGKRVGEGYMEVNNLPGGQQAKVPVTAHAMGSFVRMELQPQHLPTDEPMKIKMSITSVPAGASLKVDSQDAGMTPQLLSVVPGKHVLEFSKEGYASASTPLEVVENAPPGRLNLELTPLSLDTVVLRDGSVLLGNVTSVTTTGVTITVKAKVTKLERRRVARVIFSENSGASSVRKATANPSRQKR